MKSFRLKWARQSWNCKIIPWSCSTNSPWSTSTTYSRWIKWKKCLLKSRILCMWEWRLRWISISHFKSVQFTPSFRCSQTSVVLFQYSAPSFLVSRITGTFKVLIITWSLVCSKWCDQKMKLKTRNHTSRSQSTLNWADILTSDTYSAAAYISAVSIEINQEMRSQCKWLAIN